MKYLFFVFFAMLASCKDKYSVGSCSELYVEFEKEWEGSQGMFYSISKNGIEIVPKTYFGGVEDGRNLVLVKSKSSVVGLAPEGQPHSIVILYDEETGESWPYSNDNEIPSVNNMRGAALFEKMMQDMKDDKYKLLKR